MSQYLLDSNVLSELWKKDPAASVLDWLDSSEWLIPVVVIAEIQEGAEAAPSLARREEISRKLANFPVSLWTGIPKPPWSGRNCDTAWKSNASPKPSGTV